MGCQGARVGSLRYNYLTGASQQLLVCAAATSRANPSPTVSLCARAATWFTNYTHSSRPSSLQLCLPAWFCTRAYHYHSLPARRLRYGRYSAPPLITMPSTCFLPTWRAGLASSLQHLWLCLLNAGAGLAGRFDGGAKTNGASNLTNLLLAMGWTGLSLLPFTPRLRLPPAASAFPLPTAAAPPASCNIAIKRYAAVSADARHGLPSRARLRRR